MKYLATLVYTLLITSSYASGPESYRVEITLKSKSDDGVQSNIYVLPDYKRTDELGSFYQVSPALGDEDDCFYSHLQQYRRSTSNYYEVVLLDQKNFMKLVEGFIGIELELRQENPEDDQTFIVSKVKVLKFIPVEEWDVDVASFSIDDDGEGAWVVHGIFRAAEAIVEYFKG